MNLRIAAVGLALGVALAGCSSGDDGGRAPATTAESGGDAVELESAAAQDRVPDPRVTRASGGRGRAMGGLGYDVAEFDYQEHELLFGGTASALPAADLPPAPYRSRMVVWTPADPERFNGTTVVEWAHNSDAGQYELTVELNDQSQVLIEQGFAFVLVSAQQRGVCAPTPTGCPVTSLAGADPGRYGTLRHPGDAYSFDIFNQALQAIRFPQDVAPLGGLETRFLIAEGFQPSIEKYVPNGATDPTTSNPLGINGPLNAYLANGADDDARLVDGFLIDAAEPGVEPTYRVPVLHHLDESAIRRNPVPDRANHVTWEVVGAPHADRWATAHIDFPGPGELEPLRTRAQEEAQRREFENYGQEPDPRAAVCSPSPDAGTLFPRRFTLNAALVALDRWVTEGEPAPAAPLAERRGPPEQTATDTLERDPDGNAIGGLRSPIIDVPVAAYHGEACIEAGTTTRFSADQLAERYPTHRSYVEQLLTATDEAVDGRFLLCEDAETILRGASASAIGGGDPFTSEPQCA